MLYRCVFLLLLSASANSTCYRLYDKTEALLYEYHRPPFDLSLSPEGEFSREYERSRARGEQLIVNHDDDCVDHVYNGVIIFNGHQPKANATNSDATTTDPNTCDLSGTPERDEKGKIIRSEKAKNDFKKEHPCPATGKASGSCPGYVIDHRIPLACGGADDPCNMQWQTKAAAKQKDKTELDTCRMVGEMKGYTESNVQNQNYGHGVSSGYLGYGIPYSHGPLHTGPRGGVYYFNRNGNKQYIKHR